MNDNLKNIAASFAQEYQSDAIYPAHLFKALMHKEAGLIPFIESSLDKDYYYLQDWADVQMQLAPKSVRPIKDHDWSKESLAVIEEAQNYQRKFDDPNDENIALLAAIVTPGVGFSFNELKTLPLTSDEIIAKVGTIDASNSVTSNSASKVSATKGNNMIAKYCVNKLVAAKDGLISPVIGFEKEIATIIEILGRKTKSNLLITGESGVGKTALINGFCLQMAKGEVPGFLQETAVYELDTAALTADASYKGEIEDRFKKLMEELATAGNTVLVIESVDKFFDKQNTLYALLPQLEQELSRGNVSVLCTASIDGFTKFIETDKEIMNKFERLMVEEPNADMTLRILMGAIPEYETYHDIQTDEKVLEDSIRLAKRYMTEKSLPDSAFDLIDRTMAQLKTMNDVTGTVIESLKQDLSKIETKSKKQGENKDEIMKELSWLYSAMTNKVNCILSASIDLDADFSKIPTIEERIKHIKSTLEKLDELSKEKRVKLLSSDLDAVVAKHTGIPLGKVQTKERDRLLGAEEQLKKRVIGQDHAIKKVLDAVYEARSGLNKKGQPMGSFFFLGPTGTGKTELSKALAAFLFGDESSLIRFDMSEFKEEHSVALLYGAPPGYVGYEEGGLLVNKIRQHPYAVVLFDEIEKAHKSVFDLFLQILDEGKLHDRLGRVGDFSNALLLFTSNIGSQFIVDKFNAGSVPENNDLMDIMQGYFRPEFLGRLTEIVPFSPITEKTVVDIFNIHLKGLIKLLAEQNITLELTDEARKTIALRGFNPQYGARPILGIIRKELRHPLSKKIIAGEIKNGATVRVVLDKDGNPEFQITNKE